MARNMAATGLTPDMSGCSDLRLHRGERFRYVYDYGAHWQCDIRLEAILPRDPTAFLSRVYWRPNRPHHPRTAGGPGRIWSGSISIAYHPPLDAMGVVADAISALLEADPQTSVREAAGRSRTTLREAVDCLEAYQQFQPEHFDRRTINTQLRAWPWQERRRP